MSNPWVADGLGLFSTEDAVVSVAVSGRHAVVGTYLNDYPTLRAMLTVLDVSDLTAIVQLGSCELDANQPAVAVNGAIAYVADGDLHMIPITDPAAPIDLGVVDTPGTAQDVAVNGGFVYVADGLGGLLVFGPGKTDVCLPSVFGQPPATPTPTIAATPTSTPTPTITPTPSLTPTPTATPQPRDLPAYDDGQMDGDVGGGNQGSIMAVHHAVVPAARVVSARNYLGGEMHPVRFIVWDSAWQELYAETIVPTASSGGSWWTWTLPSGIMAPHDEVYVGYQCLSDYAEDGPWIGLDRSDPDGETYAGPWPPSQRWDFDAMIRVTVQ